MEVENRVFVGGIPYKTTERELKRAFDSCASVISVSIVRDRTTGKSKGFGFIDFQPGDSFDNAIKSLHNSVYEGRMLSVCPAVKRL